MQDATSNDAVVECTQVTLVLPRAVHLIVQIENKVLLLEFYRVQSSRFVTECWEATHHGRLLTAWLVKSHARCPFLLNISGTRGSLLTAVCHLSHADLVSACLRSQLRQHRL